MGLLEYLEETEKKIALEDEAGEYQRLVVGNLLKKTKVPLGEIAYLVDIPLETVRKITVLSIIEQLTEIKRRKILKECRASDYNENYSAMFVRDYVGSYKAGLQDGFELVGRRFVETLLERSGHSIEEIASLAGVSLETVKKIKEGLNPD